MAGDVAALRPLREDLRLTRGGMGFDGSPIWVIQDPLTDQFFQISFEMFQAVSLWNLATSSKNLTQLIFEKFGRTPETQEIDALQEICSANNLFQEKADTGWRAYHAAAAQKQPWYMALLHNYIFFKIPLFTPDRFLRFCWPFVSIFFTRSFVVLSLCALLGGLYLVSRQWESFINSFPYFFTFNGICMSILAVILIKSLHELGHGFMAHKYGCRTTTMGVAFMALAPMLYSDVTDAWKLSSRRQRMMIDAAGIMVELALGMWCLLAWSFLPDGPLRSAVFVAATISWVTSLLINLNPMARFDGYFILSDLLAMPNLQNRAFAHMRHVLRVVLFGPMEDHAETFTPGKGLLIFIIGVATAVYRFFLYVGIALLVYHFFIKALGVLMLMAELFIFFLMPVWRELKVWWSMRNAIFSNWRTYASTFVVLSVMVGLFLPLSRSLEAPAVLEPASYQRIFAEGSGVITNIGVRNGQRVRKDEPLYVIDAPNISQKRRIAEAQLRANRLRVGRIAADASDLRDRKVLEQEGAQLVATLDGLNKMQDRLVVKAPFDGFITDVPSVNFFGKWISGHEPLGLLIGGNTSVARGFAEADDVRRLQVGSKATFIPDDITQAAVQLSLSHVATSSSDVIDLPALTSLQGGDIAVNPDSQKKLVPEKSQFQIQADAPTGSGVPIHTLRGKLRLKAAPESLASRLWRNVMRVLVKETGA